MANAERPARPAARRTAIGTTLLVGCLTLGAGAVGCANPKADAAAVSSPETASKDATIPDVVATIGDQKITMADVRARVGDELDQAENRYRAAEHRIVDGALRQILNERVLQDEAKKQGKTMDDLLAAEVGGSLEPSDVEIATWYKENPTQTGGRPLEQIRAQIADYLRAQRRKEATTKLQARLDRERKVMINLQPYRVALDNAGAPARGSDDAKVTLVEFSDFQCPFCGRFFPTLKQIEQKYGDSVRVVYRQYPIPSLHPNAFKAAEASLCANDQGKFWDMHDVMFQEQNALTVSELKQKARRIGLDGRKFDDCMDTGRHTEQVQNDMRAGSRVGVTGTPALFVNGIPIDGGAVPLATVVQAIDQEFARVKK